jgi:LmbE family N-acetylglucosaminyl deacetylase
MFPRTAAPTFVVDISDFAEKKHQAVSCYRSQLYDPGSKEPETNLSSEAFLRRVEARQRFYGSLIAVEHAEGFIVREALNINDPIELLSRKMNMYS